MGTLLLGKLDVTIVRADNLVSFDWKGAHPSSDPYCLITAFPNSQAKDGSIFPVTKRIRTVPNTISPKWDASVSYAVSWTKVVQDEKLSTNSTVQTPPVEGTNPEVPTT